MHFINIHSSASFPSNPAKNTNTSVSDSSTPIFFEGRTDALKKSAAIALLATTAYTGGTVPSSTAMAPANSKPVACTAVESNTKATTNWVIRTLKFGNPLGTEFPSVEVVIVYSKKKPDTWFLLQPDITPPPPDFNTDKKTDSNKPPYAQQVLKTYLTNGHALPDGTLCYGKKETGFVNEDTGEIFLNTNNGRKVIATISQEDEKWNVQPTSSYKKATDAIGLRLPIQRKKGDKGFTAKQAGQIWALYPVANPSSYRQDQKTLAAYLKS